MDQLTTDISKLRATIDLVRNEPVEKVQRSNNIVIRGVPESADLSDTDIIQNLLKDIGVTDIPISNISRLGKQT